MLLILLVMLIGEVRSVYGQEDHPTGLRPDAPGSLDDSTVADKERETEPFRGDIPEWHAMITNLPGDWVRGAQVTVRPAGLQTIVAISVLTGILISTDASTYRSTQNLLSRNPWMQSGFDFLEHIGNGRTHLEIAAAFAVVGVVGDDSRSLRVASQTVEGLLATGIVVQMIKHISGRESPEAATADGGVWRLFPNPGKYQRHQARYYAFPSGHIATTMSTVTIIAENYPEVGWIRPVGYTIVGFVGIGLVGGRYHWYSDLPLGIAIGYAFGSIVAHRDLPPGATDRGEWNSPLTVLPSVGPDGAGVTLAYSF